MKTVFKGPFMSFLGLTSLYLVNIQPNSKVHPPYQNFLDPLMSAGSRFFFRTPPFEISWCAPETSSYYSTEPILKTLSTCTILMALRPMVLGSAS